MCCSDSARLYAIDAKDRNFNMALTTNKRQEHMFGQYKYLARKRSMMNPLMADGITGAIHYNRQVFNTVDTRTITSLKLSVRPLMHLK